jgi:hypothetical protein
MTRGSAVKALGEVALRVNNLERIVDRGCYRYPRPKNLQSERGGGIFSFILLLSAILSNWAPGSTEVDDEALENGATPFAVARGQGLGGTVRVRKR